MGAGLLLKNLGYCGARTACSGLWSSACYSHTVSVSLAEVTKKCKIKETQTSSRRFGDKPRQGFAVNTHINEKCK